MKDQEWFGRLPRSPPRQAKEFDLKEFARYCEKQQFMSIPDNVWRIPTFSPVAQYDEFAKFLIVRPSLCRFAPQKIIDRAMDMLNKHFGFYMRNCRPLTWDEAVARLRLLSSCGYPYNIRYWSKKMLLTIGDWYHLYHEWVEALASGKPLPAVFQQNAKWELRKVGKSTRTFLPGPADLHMFQVIWFTMQNDALVASHQKTWFGCGLSPFKGGWNRLYTSLLRFGTCFFESDVSGWDRSVSADLRWAICQMRFLWLPKDLQTEKNWRMISTSYDMAINAFVVLENGDLTRKYGGTSSGEYNTLDDNCLIHFLVVMLVLLRMKPDLEYSEVMQVMSCKFVGDDNLGALKIKEWPWFTFEAFQQGYQDLGFTIKYIKHSDNLMEREFLSLKFVHRYGMILGAPDRIKTLCSMRFGNHYDDKQYIFLRALELRMNAFADEPLFMVISGWIEEYYRENQIMLEREETDFPWSEIRAHWKSTSELIVLHCGYE